MAGISQNTLDLQSILNTVNALPQVGVEVKKASGTFRTGSSGLASVGCGFKPDMVFIHKNEGTDGYIYHAAAAISEESRSGNLNIALYADNSTYYLYDFVITATDSGFTAEGNGLTYSDYEFEPVRNMTFYYVAVKYTA